MLILQLNSRSLTQFSYNFLLFCQCIMSDYDVVVPTDAHIVLIYRVIQKSLRDFRHLQYSSRDDHAEGEHVSRGRDTPSFCPTLQMLDISTLGDAADVSPVIKFLPHMYNVCGRNCTTEVGNPGGTYELPCIFHFIWLIRVSAGRHPQAAHYRIA